MNMWNCQLGRMVIMMVNLSLEEAIRFVKDENPSLNDDEVRAEALRMIKVSNQSMNEVMLKE